MSEPSRERLEALTRKAAKAIKEAGAESVVIIITCDADGGDTTGHYKTGAGNYFAQRGSVIEWIDQTREIPPIRIVDPPDDADAWKDA